MNQEHLSLLAEVVACRNTVDDYANRIDKACEEYYATRKTEFPNLSRAEDEDVSQRCELVLSHLTSIMPDVTRRWENIKYPSHQYDQMVERMCDIWIRRRNLFREIENTLRTTLELDNLLERNRIEASKPQKSEIIMGNKYNFGNITGSNVNVDSILDKVTQNVGSTPNIDEADKKQLAELIEQLKVELQKTPPMNKEEAEALAEFAKALVEAGTKDQPNKTTVQITAEGLKKAAQNIASVMPSVVIIATGIVKTVFQLTGLPIP